MTFKAKMINCSNEQSKGMSELQNIGRLDITENSFYFRDIKSSKLQSITFGDKVIIIETLNTKYTFIKIGE